MKKLWSIEVWHKIGCRALRNFVGGYEILQDPKKIRRGLRNFFHKGCENFFARVANFFANLRKFPAFSFFVFFSSFSCLILLKTVSQH